MPSSAVETEALIAAVTEPSRRQMLDLLLERGESTATVLADSLPISRQAVSKHLAVFTRVGLVEREKRGREMRYRLNVERLDQATRSLGELAAIWDQRLMRIKQIAETATAHGASPVSLDSIGPSRNDPAGG
jgi:ArsR family transcriptional regulator, cadmium/lead-responsive transcriptional repressor